MFGLDWTGFGDSIFISMSEEIEHNVIPVP